jgi:phosphocarrier protein HPr
LSGLARRTVVICNKRGLHARAAARFVKLAETFSSEVTVRRREQSVSGQSIMGLMMLAAVPGASIDIEAQGEDAQAAVGALATLVERRFDEDA